MPNDAKPNRLIDEKSPYLQQHAFNPVDWYPWGEEAFERARAEDRPIFLSIGYSTCHWCHVMERESFEDPETAKLMNDLFVNIKVDREERPDVDQVYMTAVQALTQSGGWPLSAFLTPELKPFYLGTYFPPAPAFNRPSFRSVLTQLHDAWMNRRREVVESAENIAGAVEQLSVVEAAERTRDDTAIAAACFDQIASSYDSRFGGFGPAPKFPRPVMFEFLLRYHAHHREEGATASDIALQMTLHTMRHMASGGMYDQLGGGFARYSVDAQWRVPHFEKMLYDQGQLLAAYSDAYRLSGDEYLADVIRHTVAYLKREMTDDTGAFFSAEDADSEGEEGTYYVWTREQLVEVLDERELKAVETFYGISEAGNWEHGRNVLHISATLHATAEAIGGSVDDADAVLAGARGKLLAARERRIRPSRDEKIITAWNGLAISGLARAAAALGRTEFAELAERAADAILETMRVDGRLMRRMKDGEVKVPGFLDDYAFLAAGLLDLYEATFDVRYLREADRLAREAIVLFGDENSGGFYLTAADDDPNVLVRSRGDYDGAEPSGNSVMALVLLRLGGLFHDDELTAMARRTLDLFMPRIERYPMMAPLMVSAAMAASRPPRQIVIAAAPDADATNRLVEQIRTAYLPDTSIVFVPADGADAWLRERLDLIEGMVPVDGRAAAYVCENFICHRPVTSFER